MTGVSSVWAAPTIGTAAAVQGNVYVLTEGAKRKAQVRSSIQLNDEVQTKDDSALQILLLDRTTFTVGQNCSMIIDEFVYDPSGPSGTLSARVLTGAFRYVSGQVAKANPKNTTLLTPSASIGIRGTMLEGVIGPDAVTLAEKAGLDVSGANQQGASITILRGPGMGANTLDSAGAITVTSAGVTKTILEPGYFIFSPSPDLPPIGPLPITAAMLEYLDFFLRSTPSGPTEDPTDVGGGPQESGQHKFEGDQGTGFNPSGDDGIDDGLLRMDEEMEEDDDVERGE
ncbi:MAG: hypothetical protein ABJH63_06570 [Rhizobiaceae bacterium]